VARFCFPENYEQLAQDDKVLVTHKGFVRNKKLLFYFITITKMQCATCRPLLDQSIYMVVNYKNENLSQDEDTTVIVTSKTENMI